ncbi:MAG: D-cysteine desulfhydrase family protein [Paracoccaceae bacterium]
MSDHFNKLLQKLPQLSDHTRIELISAPSALENLPNLSAGLGVQIDAKRDDTLPLGMGGNKVRQLEYYLGPAVEMGADTVLITGAVQSNFTRTCAAAARRLGMHPILQMEERVPKEDPVYRTSGNVLLSTLMGAEVVHFPTGNDEAAADANLDRIADELRENGRISYVIHLGIDHPPLGGLGYAAAAVETWLQYQSLGTLPDHVIIPSGSGLTHAGFLAGARAIGWDVSVLGICVRRDADQQRTRIQRRTTEILNLLGAAYDLKSGDIQLSDACLAPGYGLMNPQVGAAISLAAVQEALLLDPVYSGRAMAGLIQHIETGTIRQNERVTFIHTGGTPAIFAYQSDLTKALEQASDDAVN